MLHFLPSWLFFVLPPFRLHDASYITTMHRTYTEKAFVVSTADSSKEHYVKLNGRSHTRKEGL